MKISEFYNLTKADQRMFVINWLNSKTEYAFQIRCDEVKKPQKHSFIECRDQEQNPDVHFEIEIAKMTVQSYLYTVSFNCSDERFKRFHELSFNDLTDSIESVFEYMFDFCLWTGRHEYHQYN